MNTQVDESSDNRQIQKDACGAGGTTTLNCKTRKINVLRVFVFKGVTDLVMDFVKYMLLTY